jgi:hypothetical protein
MVFFLIVWRGLGFLVPIIGFACALLTELAVDGIAGQDSFYTKQGWPILLAMAIAAAIIWPLGRALNRYDRNAHSLFVLPMEYWALACFAIGVIGAFTH